MDSVVVFVCFGVWESDKGTSTFEGQKVICRDVVKGGQAVMVEGRGVSECEAMCKSFRLPLTRNDFAFFLKIRMDGQI